MKEWDGMHMHMHSDWRWLAGLLGYQRYMHHHEVMNFIKKDFDITDIHTYNTSFSKQYNIWLLHSLIHLHFVACHEYVQLHACNKLLTHLSIYITIAETSSKTATICPLHSAPFSQPPYRVHRSASNTKARPSI